jgi:hypothetical protein
MNRPNNKPAAKPATEPGAAAMPAMGMTSKDLPDRLRPEVVDIEVLENLADMPSAAASDGTGTSGNIRPRQRQASPPPLPPEAHVPRPPQQL